MRCFSPKHKNSLKNLIASNPEGLDDKTIAKALMMSEEELEAVYQKAISNLKEALTVGMEED